jgi:hypothetical protein
VNEIAGLRARCEFAVRAPTHFAYARQHICDGLLLAMMGELPYGCPGLTSNKPPHNVDSTPSCGATAAWRFEPGVCSVPLSNSEGRTIRIAEESLIDPPGFRSKAPRSDRGFASEFSRVERNSLSYIGRRGSCVRLREPKRWYAPNASTLSELADSGHTVSPPNGAAEIRRASPSELNSNFVAFGRFLAIASCRYLRED